MSKEAHAPSGLPFVVAELSEAMQEIELYVFSDLHVGDPHFDRERFEQTRAWVLSAENRYCILNGDILNAALPGTPGGPYDDVMSPRDQLRWAKRAFEPLKERILLITEGNHEYRIAKSTSLRAMEELADHLGVEDRFCPDGGLLKITFGTKRNGKRAAYSIYVTHGASGAQLEGGKALAMGRMSHAVFADVYVQGHTHWKAAFKQAIWVPDMQNNCNRLVEQLYVNSSTLLRWGGYAQVRGYKPAAQGAPHIRLYAEPKRAEAVV